MHRVEKREIVEKLRAEIAKELANMTKAAKDAAEAATHPEARPENDKDTRGLEASYLARGQAARVRELELADNTLQFLPLRDLAEDAEITVGALVELQDDAGASVYFVSPAGGGVKIRAGEQDVTVVTPEAPLGRALIGKRAGDAFEMRVKGSLRELEVTRVR